MKDVSAVLINVLKTEYPCDGEEIDVRRSLNITPVMVLSKCSILAIDCISPILVLYGVIEICR